MDIYTEGTDKIKLKTTWIAAGNALMVMCMAAMSNYAGRSGRQSLC